MKLRKYNSAHVLLEAGMFLNGMSISDIAYQLNMPNQTVSWHLINPLKELDYNAWLCIRYKLLRRARNKNRAAWESMQIDNSGFIESIEAQWDELERMKKNEIAD